MEEDDETGFFSLLLLSLFRSRTKSVGKRKSEDGEEEKKIVMKMSSNWSDRTRRTTVDCRRSVIRVVINKQEKR